MNNYNPNFLNPRRFQHFNTNTFKGKGKNRNKKLVCSQVILPLERPTSGIMSRVVQYYPSGDRGHGQQPFGRRYIESMRTPTHVYHATKGYRKA